MMITPTKSTKTQPTIKHRLHTLLFHDMNRKIFPVLSFRLPFLVRIIKVILRKIISSVIFPNGTQYPHSNKKLLRKINYRNNVTTQPSLSQISPARAI